MIISAFCSAILVTLWCAPADSTPQSRALAAIADEVSRHQLASDLNARLTLGLPIERMPDPTRAGAVAEGRWAAAQRGRLDRITDEGLSDDEMLTLRVLGWRLRLAEEAPRHHALSFADLTPYSSPLRNITLGLAALPLTSDDDLASYRRLQVEAATYLAQVAAEVGARAGEGIRLARDQVPPVMALLRAFRTGPESTPFAPTAAQRNALATARDPATADRFIGEMRASVSSLVEPALDALIATFDADYLSRAPARIGLGQYRGGRAAYEYAARFYTTTDLSPEAIHVIGLDEVARIEREMAAIRAELGFRGTALQFLDSLRRDARFYATTPEEVGERLTMYLRRIEPVIGTMFSAVPRAAGEVRRLDTRLEASQTFGYYDPPDPSDPVGHYYFNASKLSERSQVSAGALLYHELLPGHHLQIALTLERADLPSVRRSAMLGAYTEGWGEYASMLAGEMGMYRDPWERYGRLLMEMFLACRLVVDTGINAFSWSRDSATAYMAARVIESPTQLATETLRYGADINAQALSYKIGAVEMIRLRARARAALGARFDIREFHDVLLSSGPLPMTVLSWKVDRWLASKSSRD